MNLAEALRAALGSLRANRLRTFLTLLGMVIGVFAIITSVTAVKVIDVYFKDRMALLGTSTFTVSRYPAIQLSGGSGQARRAITYDQVQRLEESIQEPVAISVQQYFDQTSVRYEARETDPDVALLGTDQNFLENFSYEVQAGRGFAESDVHYNRGFAVLGATVAEELFPNESPLGKVITMRGRRYQVIGVLVAKGNFLGMNMDRRVFIPITHAFLAYGRTERNISPVSIRALGQHRLGPAMEEVVGRMRVIRKVPPGEPNDFEIETNDSMRAIFDAFTGVLAIGGAGIGIIALLAAGIGIMNIMLVSVTERTREIGVRKSVGARRRDVMRQFLLEAFVLCQIGGGIGIILGAMVGNLTAVQFGISGAIPWNWAVATIIIVTFIALVFGGYPAARAARLDPVESLRYE